MLTIPILMNTKTLKRYWKLLLMPTRELDCIHFRPKYCFKNWVSDRCIVEHILEFNPQLKENYETYQMILTAVKQKDIELLENTLKRGKMNPLISDKMNTAINTCINNLILVRNMITTDFNNGRLEGIINKIKMMKRVSYGFRKFNHLKLRIL